MRAGSRSLGWIVVGCLAVASYGCGDNSPGTSPDAKDGPVTDSGVDRGSDAHTDAGPATGGTDGHADTATGGSDGSADAGPSDKGPAATGGTDGGGSDVTPPTPTCSDGIKNGTETGTDCGGTCGPCGAGKPCNAGTDCQFGVCETGGTCGACGVPSDCPGVESECQHRTCTTGVCGLALEPAGTVLAVQTTGDCVSRQCGADGKVSIVNDATDVPDDKNPCTNDICTAGVPSHTNQPDKTSCGGANECNASGQCVGCTLATDCPGTDTACRTRTCSAAGVCGVTLVASGTKLPDPTPLDCRGQQCDGMGNIQNVNDDSDLPVDGNPCTTDECNSGTTSHQPVGSGTSCGGGKVCDGATNCVECLSASTCTGTDTDCQTRTCMLGKCGVSFATAGTPTSAQTPKDCQQVQCVGDGTTTSVADDSDLPDDSNPCTSDSCVGKTPTFTNLSAEASCGSATGGSPMVCNGAGMCQGCVMPSDCPGSDTECKKRTCTLGMCGTKNVDAGTLLMAQVSGDCQKVQCNGQGSSQSVDDSSDIPVDPNACTMGICVPGTQTPPALVPSTQPLIEGTSCGQSGQSLLCDGHGSCVGCTKDSECGTSTNADCQTVSCDTTTNKCVVANTAKGKPTTTTPAQTPGDCQEIQCDGNGGTMPVIAMGDTKPDGNACTQDLCDSNGNLSYPPENAGKNCSQNNGVVCNGSMTAPACVQCIANTGCTGGLLCSAAGSCVQCLVTSDCGSNTDCHTVACNTGVCSTTPIHEGNPTGTQVAGDCHTTVCMGGNPVSNADPGDSNDNNDCTLDSCNGGTPTHMVTLDATCGQGGGGKCDVNGACVGCVVDQDCPLTGRECVAPSCGADETCGTKPIDAGIPATTQIVGDCQQLQCNGAGGIMPEPDDSDVPVVDDGNPCTLNTCSGGVPYPPAAARTGCGTGGLCDGNGTCVQCLMNSDCVAPVGSDPQCYSATCNTTTGMCVPAFTAKNTPVSGQTPGDCTENVCDGNGFITQIPDSDDSDAPADATGNCQTNHCVLGSVVPMPNPFDLPPTTNSCNPASCGGLDGGTPSHLPQPHGFSCTDNGGRTCDGAGNCLLMFSTLRIGDGAAALNATAAKVFVEEHSVDGTLIGTAVQLPIANAGTVHAFGLAGNESSEGSLALSGDGRFLTLAGYNATPGTTGIKGTTSAANNRMAARIDASLAVDTSTLLGSMPFTANNIRSAISDDGSGFWVGGAGGGSAGIWYIPIGQTPPTPIQIYTTAIRWLQLFGGQIYVTGANDPIANIQTIGTGAPKSGTQTGVHLAGMATAGGSTSPYSFVFFNRNGIVSGFDTLYVADDGNATSKGVQKWTSTDGVNWVQVATLNLTTAVGFRGLAGVVRGGSVTLIASTTEATLNRVVVFVDDGVTLPSVVATAPANELYKGIALSPHL